MADRYEVMRDAMIASQLRPNMVDDQRLIAAMALVKRELFVPSALQATAYADVALPLGHGRMMNSPMVTGRLIDALGVIPGERVLVIAGGSGYSVALLRALGATVTMVEPIAALATQARELVGDTVLAQALGEGAPGSGPFDAMLIEGAIAALPDALRDQLAAGGRVAMGLLDGPTTRLALGRRGRNGFSLVPFADADIAILADFAPPRSFVF